MGVEEPVPRECELVEGGGVGEHVVEGRDRRRVPAADVLVKRPCSRVVVGAVVISTKQRLHVRDLARVPRANVPVLLDRGGLVGKARLQIGEQRRLGRFWTAVAVRLASS